MICNVCGANKPKELFYSKDNSCKECRKEKVRHYRAINLKKIQRYDRVRGQTDARKKHVKKYTDKMKKEFPEKWRAMRYKACKKYKSNNIEKIKAENTIAYLLRSGQIERGPCAVCGAINTDGHHPDYDRPDYVIWLCGPHHREEHKKLKEIERA